MPLRETDRQADRRHLRRMAQAGGRASVEVQQRADPRNTWCIGFEVASQPNTRGAASSGTVAPADGGPRMTNASRFTSRPMLPSAAMTDDWSLRPAVMANAPKALAASRA